MTKLTTIPSIVAVSPNEFREFIIYLNDHLAENGSPEVGYFQPMARNASIFPADREAAFLVGLEVPVANSGWRRAWVARTPGGKIVGHIDLRAHPDRFTGHRCLLGMGVHREHRKRGVGGALIEYAKRWAASSESLEWIDLQVLTSNLTAIDLYRKAGFQTVGEIVNMFKLDNQYLSYTTMNIHMNYSP